MKYYTKACAGILIFAVVSVIGCKQSMVISKVDYSQPIESVITPDEDGTVEDIKHGLKFNILPIQYKETQDTSSVTTSEIRYIRGSKGYYYLTAPTYKNVYMMSSEEAELKLLETFPIKEPGIDKPAFNQREGYIQLVNRTTGEQYRLTPEGMVQEQTGTEMIEGQ
ncbi:hypothetical protein [Fodinibius salsisoli]|uniref:Lipoprotein n=1 Tax=Fodinibius salsisoli TaxID=2820877 RepID=A0ABT3PJU5_9BACT|nr:hypothetical protein [Fodinibius salsisoli]MCW9706196.1 hypothetical protein [Fodinibius salsisoli]